MKTAAESLGISQEKYDEIVDECIYGEGTVIEDVPFEPIGIPASECLETEINRLSKRFPEVSFAKLSRIAVHVAKWQKEKDKKLVITDDLRNFVGKYLRKYVDIKNNSYSEWLAFAAAVASWQKEIDKTKK